MAERITSERAQALAAAWTERDEAQCDDPSGVEYDLAREVVTLHAELTAARTLADERGRALEALREAVAMVRTAVAAVATTGAQHRAAWDAASTPPTAAQSDAIGAAQEASYGATDALSTALDALLRGTPPPAVVDAALVRAYLDARDALAFPRPEGTLAALRDDVVTARAALDAALGRGE